MPILESVKDNSRIAVAALTDHVNTSSSRFRIRQIIPVLIDENIVVTDYPRKFSTESAGQWYPDVRIRSNPKKLILAAGFEVHNLGSTLLRTLKSRKYDATWVSRELVIGYPTFERFINDTLLYDIDDAVFLGGSVRKRGVNALIRRAKYVFAGNQYLADYCSQFSRNVLIVPTAVNTDRFFPLSVKSSSEKFVVGWSGTSSSFKYLVMIENQLKIFFETHPAATLKICADRFPTELSSLSKYIVFEKWSSNDEVRQIQEFDVGLMPIENSEWIKGKCAYKMLLYASCGIPTIASNFGVNKEVLAMGKLGIACDSVDMWSDALNFVFENRDSLNKVFPDCRKVIEDKFSLTVVSHTISKAMKLACAK
jgi:glycosyltransferase involved in cell wall biosynthesis